MKDRLAPLVNEPKEIRYQKLKDVLKEHKIRVSHQRLMILDYLLCSDIHPTADEIFQNLKLKDPVLSQATVYNTLNLLVNHNLISELDFNQPSKRYDFYSYHHSHFLCESCGKIIDLDIDEKDLRFKELEGYQIDNIEVIIRGICPDCKAGQQKV
ncbi:MAG: Fur family transcriptional regulator [Peptoniphilaceae bacterium]|nr:Fur family transcriptional regulator [Peptoniphilaceae bacterium]MDY6019413.1 Fur family transcriptional regulator [Anaerococcus sp.]